MLDKVIDNLYISGAHSVISEDGRKGLVETKIESVLTISAMSIPEDKRVPHIDYRFLFAMDLANHDLLGSGVLEEGVSLIEECISHGKPLLVHCESGVSRSVTLVAGYLMRRFNWTPDKAVVFVRKARPTVQPNDGFMRQLAIFGSLNCHADAATLSRSSEYRRWCVETGNVPQNGSDSRAKLFVKNIKPQKPSSSNSTSTEPAKKGDRFRCAKCRNVLFYEEHLMAHKNENHGDCSFGYLIEPMKWMNLDTYQGKVSCPSCSEKLGNFSWGGRVCQGEKGEKCGHHVSPWVHLHKDKIDQVKATPMLGALYQPPSGVNSNSPTSNSLPNIVLS
ncbi:hypothetical protein WR25_26872 [Diploscapter pachys]|uniref:protein-tyrosine-phosphatase n=1 Tax=Diploscapter pachys TaxID=2018661 RepID=A0A2A2L6Q9_9BILA|nr:hypothetical protein WR25_26872 [Diploscapter pachys]